MMRLSHKGLFLAGVAIVAIVACQEDLTTPGECPGICPGGVTQVGDTVITALQDGDSSFRGYVGRNEGSAVLVSNGLPAGEARGWYGMDAIPESLFIKGVLLPYTIDSIRFSAFVIGRDSLVDDLKLLLYLLPATVDSTTTFAELTSYFTPDKLVDSILVPDSVISGGISTIMTGEAITRLRRSGIEPDTGNIVVGLRMEAGAPSGARLSSVQSGGTPTLTVFARSSPASDDTARATVGTLKSGFAFQGPQVNDPDLLTLGGFPSSRALIRFRIPRRFVDSVSMVRATLQLTPAMPIIGLPNDRSDVAAFPVLADLGRKSLVPLGITPPTTEIKELMTGVVSIDVLPIVLGWAGVGGPPHNIILSLLPEAASFTQPSFRSTRFATGKPSIRITYIIPPRPERF